MIESKGNDPAFPIFNSDAEINHPGITKREYFAGQALNGLLSSMKFWSVNKKEIDSTDGFAKLAYQFSDAMLEAEEKK